MVSNDRADLEQILSRAFGREIAFVEVRAEGIVSGVAEEYLARHLEHTSTIDRIRKLYPQGRFEARRFRPNIVVSTGSEEAGLVENDWIGAARLASATPFALPSPNHAPVA